MPARRDPIRQLAANYLAFVKLACIRLWLRVYEQSPMHRERHGLIEFARDKVAQFKVSVLALLNSVCPRLSPSSRNLKSAIKVPGRFCANSYQFCRGQSVSRTYDWKVAAIESGGDPIDAAQHSDSPAVRLHTAAGSHYRRSSSCG